MVEVFGIDDGGVDVGEDLELVRHANVVAVGGHAVGDHAIPDLVFHERLDHPLFARHLHNPVIWFQSHNSTLS